MSILSSARSDSRVIHGRQMLAVRTAIVRRSRRPSRNLEHQSPNTFDELIKNRHVPDKCTAPFTSLWILSENGAPRRGWERDVLGSGAPCYMGWSDREATGR